MTLEIFWSDKLKISDALRKAFQKLIQEEANRLAQGHARYGEAKKGKQWIKRAELELRAYKRTGNREYLRNLRNYLFLGSYIPEHPKHHDDPTAVSATRGKV